VKQTTLPFTPSAGEYLDIAREVARLNPELKGVNPATGAGQTD
jgi:hypothetical protein